MSKKYDVIIWGASGFTGSLVTDYLYKRYGTGQSLSWAIAGRNPQKLEQVRQKIGALDLPVLIADNHDKSSIETVVEQTSVICTTVGPYAKHGDLLVETCVEKGVNYCDLTGEVQWIRRVIDAHHEQAQSKQVKIVHCCGLDSIPSDLGVYFLQQKAMQNWGEYAQIVKMRVKTMLPGFVSGGSVTSWNNFLEEIAEDREVYESVFKNPYGLNPLDAQEGLDKPDFQGVVYDEDFEAWISPYIASTVNTKMVRRSHALAGFPYGKDFQYSTEANIGGKGITGKLIAKGMAQVVSTVNNQDSIFNKMITPLFPKQGEGPSEAELKSGFFKIYLLGKARDGKTLTVRVTGNREPGYGSTCKMLAESAVCLAKDKLLSNFGVITPSLAMGDALLNRLPRNAGVTFRVVQK